MRAVYPVWDGLHETLSQLCALGVFLGVLVRSGLCLLHLVAKGHPQLGRNLDLLRHRGLAGLAAPRLAFGHDLLVGLRACAAAPGATRRGKAGPHGVAGVQAAELSARLGLHEAAQGHEGGADAPGRLPRLLVVAGYVEADLAVGLEAAAGGREAEGGRAERVRGRQDDAAVVYAPGEGGEGGASQGEVPLEEVGFQRRRRVVGRGRVGELGRLAHCAYGETSVVSRDRQTDKRRALERGNGCGMRAYVCA